MQLNEKFVYAVGFTKTGVLKYISHLDLMRLFQRAFNRAGINLEYSKGFNPHPKMSFAQPLSLGYESIGEYLEFELVEEADQEGLKNALNNVLPAGIEILHCGRNTNTKKSMAALVEAARWDVTIKQIQQKSIPAEPVLAETEAEISCEISKTDVTDKITAFLKQDEIVVQKRKKKTKKLEPVNIRPLVLDMEFKNIDDNNIMLTLLVKAGSGANLNPELLMNAFIEFWGFEKVPGQLDILRRELCCTDEGGSLQPMTNLLTFK